MNKLLLVFISCWLSLFHVYGQIDEAIYNQIDILGVTPGIENLDATEKLVNLCTKKAVTDNEYLAIVIAYCNLGYYSQQFNQPQKAIENYQKAITTFKTQKLKRYNIVENGLLPLAKLHTQSNNYTLAENTCKEALLISKNNYDYVNATLQLSVVYNNTGNYRAAIDLLKNSLKKQVSNKTQKGLVQINMAANYIALANYTAAEESLDIIPKNISENTPNYYKNRALLALKQEKFKDAQLYFKQSKQQLVQQNASNRKIAQTLIQEAQLWLSQSRKETCIQYLDEAIAKLIPNARTKNNIKTQLYAENTFIDLFDTYANATNNPELAITYYDYSVHVSNLLMHTYSSSQTIRLHQTRIKNRTEKVLELLYQQYISNPNETIAIKALEYLENNKAITLNYQANQKRLLQHYPNDEDLKTLDQLQKEQHKATYSLINSQKTATITIEKLQQIEHQIQQTKQKLSTKYTHQFYPKFNALDFQKQLLKDNTTALSFFYGNKHLYYIQSNSNGFLFHQIKLTQEVKSSLKSFIHYFDDANKINSNIEGFCKTAFALYSKLIKDTIPTEKLLIIPDGLLNFVPFESLLTQQTSNINYNQMAFWLQSKTIGYANSGLLYYKNTRTAKRKDATLGVFPVFKNSSNYLKFSIEEAKIIQGINHSTVLLENEATKENFIKRANKHNILHLSTHAQSGDFSTEAHIQFTDNPLTFSEIQSLNINAQLVVLSACETGVGKIIKGTAPQSVANAFQYAGAENLWFSLWKINDLSTSQLVDYFYQSYFNQGSGIVASRKAKQQYLSAKEIPNHRKSPYYWSAFVHYGTMTDGKTSWDSWIWVGGGIFILLILFLLWKRFEP